MIEIKDTDKGPKTRRRVKAAEEKLKTSLSLAESAFSKKWDADACPEATDRNFEILGVIGEGSYGIVYKARHAEYKIIALKVQSLSDILVADMEKRYLHALDNKFILKGLAHFKDARKIYLITPFAPYGNYKRVMHIKTERLVRPFYAQLALAFQYLHAAKITHGDAHPGNILIFRGGHIKLGDFGLAQIGTDGLVTMVGYAKYLPPEMILGRSHGSTVDWWYFGVMMYEQLVGTHPYYREDEDVVAMDREMREIMSRPLEALQGDLPVSREAEDLIKRLMEMDPAKRAGRDKDDIQAILDHEWFKEIVIGLLLDDQSVLPEFELLNLKEMEIIPVDFNVLQSEE